MKFPIRRQQTNRAIAMRKVVKVMPAYHTDIAAMVAEVSEMNEDALAHALRRAHAEAQESIDPIAAFGAFNQHSSSPW